MQRLEKPGRDYGDLQLGAWEPQGSPSTVPLLSNVQAVNSSVDGVSVQMAVTFENGSELTLKYGRGAKAAGRTDER
jgi:hypothetical protein